jgi:hypothetical protein
MICVVDATSRRKLFSDRRMLDYGAVSCPRNGEDLKRSSLVRHVTLINSNITCRFMFLEICV